jgi:hypothetical protein
MQVKPALEVAKVMLGIMWKGSEVDVLLSMVDESSVDSICGEFVRCVKPDG